MPNEGDLANEYIEQQERIFQANLKAARMVQGKSICRCGEPISESRKKLGAQLCFECKQEEERKGVMYVR